MYYGNFLKKNTVVKDNGVGTSTCNTRVQRISKELNKIEFYFFLVPAIISRSEAKESERENLGTHYVVTGLFTPYKLLVFTYWMQ